MGSFGENLRHEREMREVSLREIADHTRINLRFLEAIEEEDFEKLPGGIFNRGFIRAYAQHLGLDDVKVLSEYDLIGGVQEPTLRVHTPSQADAKLQAAGSRAQWVAAIVAVFMLIAGYALFRHSQQPFSVGIGSNPTIGEIPAPSLPETQPDPTTADSSSRPAPASLSEELILQVAATEVSWVELDADGKILVSGIMQPGKITTFRARESFNLITGNASGLILTLNGEKLAPLGRQGQPRKIRLSRENLSSRQP